ncbi:hypothetical protein WG66_010784 [Moniliophthora roreri]|nr:hypothetical protein WG66_010784 [Moniliophthora roreri]
MSIPLSEDNIYTLVQVFNSLNILGLILLTFTIIPAIIEVTMVGLLDRSHIERDPTHMFCHCHDTNIPFGVDVFIEVLTAGIDINFLIMIGQTLYKRWKTNQATVSPVGRISNPAFSMALYLRVLLFTLYLALALLYVEYELSSSLKTEQISLYRIVAIGVLKPTGPSVAWNISLPTVPVASGLIFGSQKDILQAWAGYARGLKYSIWNLIQKVLNAFRYPSRVDSIDGLKAASSQLELDQACRTHL